MIDNNRTTEYNICCFHQLSIIIILFNKQENMDFYKSFKIYKISIIGHLLKYDRNIFWITQIMSGDHEIHQLEILNEDFISFEKQLEEQNLYIFNRLIDYLNIVQYPTPKQIEQAQTVLNQFLNEIHIREDIMTQKPTLELFGLQHDLENINLHKFKQLPCHTVNRTTINYELSVQDFIYEYQQGYLAAVVQNSSELSKLGRVWSIIEPEILGEFHILKRFKNEQTERIEYKKVYLKQYEEKILSIAFQADKNKFIYGFHNGKISVFYLNASNFEDSVNNELFLSDEPILFLQDLKTTKILVTTTQSIKILDFGIVIDIVSGGSLKQRLGQSIIYSQYFNTETKRLYLGCSNGQILIYDIVNYKPQFIYQFVIDSQQKVNSIVFKKGNLFVGHDKQVSIYSQRTSPSLSFKKTAELKLPQEYLQNIDYGFHISVIEYYQPQKIFITGYSNGLVIFWNSMTGEVTGAQMVSDSKINKIILYQDYEVFMVCTEDGHLITLKFGSLNH